MLSVNRENERRTKEERNFCTQKGALLGAEHFQLPNHESKPNYFLENFYVMIFMLHICDRRNNSR